MGNGGIVLSKKEVRLLAEEEGGERPQVNDEHLPA